MVTRAASVSQIRLASPLERSRPAKSRIAKPEDPPAHQSEQNQPERPRLGAQILGLAGLSLLALPAFAQAQIQLVSPQANPAIPSSGRLRLDATEVSAQRELRQVERQGLRTPPTDFKTPTDWALAQVGITESLHPEVVRGYSQGRQEPWCAHFVSTALENTTGSPWGHDSTVAGILKWGKDHKGHFVTTGQVMANPNLLQPGDLAIWKEPDKYSHVGFVIEVSAKGYRTVEGNAPPSLFYPDGDESQGVRVKTYSFNDDQLTGFVRPHDQFAGFEGGRP